MVTADTIVTSTKTISPAISISAIVSNMDKVILGITTNMIIPNKEKVDLTAGITLSRGKKLSIIELSSKHSLIKYLFR